MDGFPVGALPHFHVIGAVLSFSEAAADGNGYAFRILLVMLAGEGNRWAALCRRLTKPACSARQRLSRRRETDADDVRLTAYGRVYRRGCAATCGRPRTRGSSQCTGILCRRTSRR